MHESRIRLSSTTLPWPPLERLAAAHPFVQQIDVVFSESCQPDEVFASLKTTYSTTRLSLSELYDYASRLPIPTESFKALPIQRDEGDDDDDTWCIDPRGVLTLCVSKALYEKLGLVGQRLPFKGCPERYVIRVPLKRETTSVAVQARQRAALGIWDGLREAERRGKWHVAYVGGGGGDRPTPPSTVVMKKNVEPCVRREANMFIPHVGNLDRLGPNAAEDEDEEAHEERLGALFEWVGMACLGAQRLRANDRVEPYVAVYEPPSPASVGAIVHLRWKGLMDSTFVQSMIDTAMSTPHGDNNAFISITLHSHLGTPVAYVPESSEKEAPVRVPGSEAEDTVCLILSRTPSRSTCAIAQSVGKWDARWG